MTQTVVNFLVNGVVEPRVFNLEVSPTGQAAYQNAMAYISNIFTRGLNLTDGLGNPIPGTAPGGPPTTQEISNIANTFNTLSQWSNALYVSNGVQKDGFQVSSQGTGSPNDTFQVTNQTVAQILTTGTATPPAGQSAAPVPMDILGTMNQNMAQNLNQMLRILKSLNWDPTNNASTANASTAFATLQADSTRSIYNFNQLLSQGIADAQNAIVSGVATIQNSGIQQMLMVDYVSQGNTILYNQMSGLQTAINANNDALTYLNSLQDLMNQKTPQQFFLALQDLSAQSIPSLTTAQYDQFESDSFNQTLGTKANFTQTNIQAYVNQLASTDGLIAGAFIDPTNNSSGSGLSSNSVTTGINHCLTIITENLQGLINELQALGETSTGPLVNSLQTVYNDFNNLLNQAAQNAAASNGSITVAQAQQTALAQWVQDTTSGNVGGYQNDLNNAIVASQSFNDSQREQLQSVMFTFEEFYKSSTTLLANFNSLLQQIARGLSM